MLVRIGLFVFSLAMVAARPSVAQDAERPGRAWVAEGGAGRAWFVDSPPVPHVVVSASARVRLSPRLLVGPEVTFMKGQGRHRDTFITANATWDLRPPAAAGPSRVAPYLVAGGGYSQTTEPVGVGLFTSREPTFTIGGGARVMAGRRWYVAPEVRLGWELHWRAGAMVGWRPR